MTLGNGALIEQTYPGFYPSSLLAKLYPLGRGAGHRRAADWIPLQRRPCPPPSPGAAEVAGLGRPGTARSAHSPRPRKPEALPRAPRSRRPEGPGVQPRAPRARAPLAHPRPGLWPRLSRRALTPVPLSHTTTFLPWLSIVCPEESRRHRRTTYSPCCPALSSSSSFFAAPPSAQLSSPNRKSPPGPTRRLRYCLRGRGGDGREEAETDSSEIQ